MARVLAVAGYLHTLAEGDGREVSIMTMRGKLGSGYRTGSFGRGGSALCYCQLGL